MVTLRSVVLGEGRPKVCVPLVGATRVELRTAAASITRADCDLVELRIDHLTAVDEPDSVRAAIADVREALPDEVPILFTFRSASEGGKREISSDGYEALVGLAVDAGVDAVDIQMLTERVRLTRMVANAHGAMTSVVLSFHDFTRTPPRSEIMERLMLQQQLGADIAKIAVMPSSARDVITLIDVTEEFSSVAAIPAITIAMGGLGVISRIAGETFGSCVTFGSVGAGSAPGQLEAHDLKQVLELLHAARLSAGQRTAAR
jgi:3-dehydroquinate dehydratase-1